MGQQESHPGVVDGSIKLSDKARRDYLARLGIDGRSRPSSSRPIVQEAPTRLESKPKESFGQEDWDLKFLDLKGQDDFRVNYLKRLSYNKVWVPSTKRPPSHQCVIIFDWDDTLLCTSFLNLRQVQMQNSPVLQRHLASIERIAGELLTTAMRLCDNVFIITNAMEGWVEYSAAKYVPGLLPILQRLRIISARTEHEQAYPGNYHEWKVQAFLQVQREMDSKMITNLISLGDSNFEMDAVHVMGAEFSQALIKTIKFREVPSPEELVKQLELVSQKFEKIVLNARNLKIGLERKWISSPRQTASPEGR